MWYDGFPWIDARLQSALGTVDSGGSKVEKDLRNGMLLDLWEGSSRAHTNVWGAEFFCPMNVEGGGMTQPPLTYNILVESSPCNMEIAETGRLARAQKF